MLNALKRLFAGKSVEVDWPAVEAWARHLGLGLRHERDPFKVVCEGAFDAAQRWRLEYGTPQRDYIEGHELRARVELDLPPTLNVLLLSRPLKEQLEAAAFERFTQAMATRIDTASPEEMRWLAMYPKVALRASEALRTRYSLVANAPAAALAWLDGRLAQRLGEHAAGMQDAPFVLMTLRGRLYLRQAAAAPLNVQLLEETLDLLKLASARARETLAQWTEDDDGSWVSTTSHAWAIDTHIDLPLDPLPGAEPC